MKKFKSQLIALSKNIFLQEFDGETKYHASFSFKNHTEFNCGGAFITWWINDRAFELINCLSKMLLDKYHDFSNFDLKSINEIIKKLYMDVCSDKNLFNIEDVFFARKNTLFECINADVGIDAVMTKITEKLFSMIRSDVSENLNLYTIPKIKGESFYIESAGIHIVDKNDKGYWNKLSSKIKTLKYYNPEKGSFYDDNKRLLPEVKYDFNYLIGIEESGLSDSSSEYSYLKLKNLISVILCFGVNFQHNMFNPFKDTRGWCMRMPIDMQKNVSVTSSIVDNVIPVNIYSIEVKASRIAKIQLWYESFSKLDMLKRKRIEICGHFINNAMRMTNTEAYIYYFTSLDALFGEKFKVGESITLGVEKLPNSAKWTEKIKYLYDLRNEFIHGGARILLEWKDYLKYKNKFDSDPTDDILDLALDSFKNAPEVVFQD